MGPESPDSQALVEGHSVLGSSSCLASSVNIHLTARAFTELVESENIRTTEGASALSSLRCIHLWAWSRPMIVRGIVVPHLHCKRYDSERDSDPRYY